MNNNIEVKLKRRFADARGHINIIEKDYKNLEINDEEFKGNISLLKINKVKKPWFVDEENRCILADKYSWLEIYPKDKNCCITAMYDENGKISEWYFDISKKIGIEAGVPFEDDLFLDVVIVPDGRIHLLDEDELEEAYKMQLINKEEYDLAYKIAQKIMSIFPENIEKLQNFTDRYLNILEK